MSASDNDIKKDVSFLADNFEKEHRRQQEKRCKMLADPVNANVVNQVTLKMEVAEKLYKLRRQSNITQKALAEKMSTNQATIAKIERGRDLKLSTIERFVEACGKHLEINFV